MRLALALAAAVALLALVVLVLRQRELREARQDLAREAARAEDAERSRDALERSSAELAATAEQRARELEASEGRVAALEASLQGEAASTAERTAALEAAVAELDAVEAQLEALREERSPLLADRAASAACWELLLWRIERQWAAGVAARPEERGLAPDPGDQVVEAVGRELERLREEVGVHAEAVVKGPLRADPLVALLVTGEALAVLAPHAERVRVELGPDELVIVGEEWSGPEPELARLRDLVAATGLLRGLGAEGGRVDLALAPPVAAAGEA